MKIKSNEKSKKAKLEDVKVEIDNINSSHRIIQAIIQQLGNSFNAMRADMEAMTKANQAIVYKMKAMEKVLIGKVCQSEDKKNEAIEEINECVSNMQIEDFMRVSDSKDKNEGFLDGDVVLEDSDIIFTSVTPDIEDDKGVLRSRMNMAEIQLQEMKDKMLGKKVGDIVEIKIQDILHKISLLGIKNKENKDE